MARNGRICIEGLEHMKTYEQFIEDRKDPKYKDGKLPCIVCGSKGAYWEIGDARYYCPACEKHARLKEDYAIYVKSQSN